MPNYPTPEDFQKVRDLLNKTPVPGGVRRLFVINRCGSGTVIKANVSAKKPNKKRNRNR